MATKTTNATEQNLVDNAPEGLALSDADLKSARKEGAQEDAKEIAKDTHRFLTDGQLPGVAPVGAALKRQQYHGHEEVQQWAHNLDLGEASFKERIAADPKDQSYIPDEKVYGLLALERNGKNRTEYVKAMMKRLDLKGDELPGGGPDYTNDTTNITKL